MYHISSISLSTQEHTKQLWDYSPSFGSPCLRQGLPRPHGSPVTADHDEPLLRRTGEEQGLGVAWLRPFVLVEASVPVPLPSGGLLADEMGHRYSSCGKVGKQRVTCFRGAGMCDAPKHPTRPLGLCIAELAFRNGPSQPSSPEHLQPESGKT